MNYTRTYGDEAAPAPSSTPSYLIWGAAALALYLVFKPGKARSKKSIQRQMDWEDEQEGRRLRNLRKKA
jgi:hypothetical protein